MLRPQQNLKLTLWVPLFILIAIGLFLIGGRSKSPLLYQSRAARAIEGYPGFSEKAVREFLAKLDPVSGPVRHLETPAGYSTSTSGGKLLFAQIADGSLGSSGQFMQTTVILVNDSPYRATGTLMFYGDAGTPLIMTIGGTSGSSFPVTLNAGATARFVTSGTGSARVGWAALRTDQPVTGTSSFAVRDTSGNVFTDVGVPEAMLSREFTLFADSVGAVDTGIALINPGSSSLEVQVDLINASGAVVRTKTLELASLGHLARYVTELFKDVSGIQEFEGTLRIRADQPFGGTTLRSVGSVLTSVPMVPDPGDVLLSNQLYFPHIADGAASGLRIRTTVLLFNNQDRAVDGTLEFIGSSGTPMNVKIGSRQASSFDYSLPPRGVRRIVTSGEGAVKAGWAQFSAEGHIAGAVVFQILDASGTPVTEVGVNDAAALDAASLVADTLGNARTGYALANPNENETEVRFRLYSKTGSLVSEKEVTFAAGSHNSQFIDELFNDAPGIGEFEGRVDVAGDDPVILLTLRQVGTLTTSLPTLSPVHGFSPTSVLDFSQNLKGTTPAIRWQLEQNGVDLALDELEISCPSCGFVSANLQPHDEIGYGYYRLSYGALHLGGGAVRVVLTGSGTSTFDMIGAGTAADPGSTIASGTLSGSSTSGFKLTLGPNSLKPLTWNQNFSLNFDLVLRDGMVASPSGAGDIHVVTRYQSSSSKSEEMEARILHQTDQRLTFVSAGSGVPRLTAARPPLLRPGETLRLQGTAFPASPSVLFEPAEGDPIEVPARIDGGEVICGIPPGIGQGTLRVHSGSQSSNPLWMASPFAPSLEVARLGGEGDPSFGLSFELQKASMQLVLQEWAATLLNASVSFSGLSHGQSVGTWIEEGDASNSFTVFVDTASSTQLELVVGDSADDPEGQISIERISDGSIVLTFRRLDDGELPQIEVQSDTISLELTGIHFTQPDDAILPFVQGTATSVAGLPSGGQSGLVSELGSAAF